jgi:hypothetical protein
MPSNTLQAVDIIGDPGWIRTSDLQLRRLLLYPLSYGATLTAAYIEFRFATPG